MLNGIKTWWGQSGVGRFARKYQADDADRSASLIAYSAVFSLFPLLVGCLTVVGLILRDPERLDALVGAIQRQFPAGVDELLTFLEETREITGILGVIAVLGLLWAGTGLIGSMTRAFNRFYGVPERAFIPQKIVEISMILLFMVLILASVLASSAASLISEHGGRLLSFLSADAIAMAPILGLLISAIAAFFLFLAIFRIVPNAPLSLGGVWRGALLSSVLFVLILQLFPLYTRFFGGGFEAYKTLGLLLLLLTWLYLLARIIVLGASLNAFLCPVIVTPRPALAVTTEASPRETKQNPLLTLGAIAVFVVLLWRRARE